MGYFPIKYLVLLLNTVASRPLFSLIRSRISTIVGGALDCFIHAPVNSLGAKIGWLPCLLLVLLCSNLARADDSARPTILVSIPPIALMVKDLVGEGAEVKTLLSKGASPHHFQLKVSDRKQLLQAELLIWVGEDMERFIEKLAKQRVDSGLAVFELMAVEGLEWPNAPEAPKPHKTSSHGHDHAHGVDPHLWLHPENVVQVWQSLASRLTQQFPGLAAPIAENLEREVAVLRQASARVKGLFEGVQKGYFVYHNGVGHFAKANQLVQLAALTEVPDEAISARHLRELSQSSRQAACLIADWAEERQANKYAKRLNLPLVLVDGIASSQSYRNFADYYTQFALSFNACFIMQK